MARAADGDIGGTFGWRGRLPVPDATGPAFWPHDGQIAFFYVPVGGRIATIDAIHGVRTDDGSTVPFTITRLMSAPDESRTLALGNGKVARFLNLGRKLDTTFGAGGVATVPGSAVTAAPAPDGDVYIGSSIVTGGNGECPTKSSALVTRLHPDGSVDSTFGVNGTVTLDIADGDAPTAMVADDGGVYVADATENNATELHCIPFSGDEGGTIVRYRTDGTVDTGFGFHGVVALPTVSATYGNGRGVGLVAAGYTLVEAHGPDVRRFSTSGALLDTYALGPMLATQLGVDRQGRFVVGGDKTASPLSRADGGYVERLLPDGSPDDSFGMCGITRAVGRIDVSPTYFGGVLITAPGNIVLELYGDEGPFRSNLGAWLADASGGVYT